MINDSDPQDTTLAFYEANAKLFYDGTVRLNMTMLYVALDIAWTLLFGVTFFYACRRVRHVFRKNK